MDEERGRFLLSLRPSHLRLVHRLSVEEEEVRKTLATRLQGYLEERDAVLEAMATATGGEENCICLTNDTIGRAQWEVTYLGDVGAKGV